MSHGIIFSELHQQVVALGRSGVGRKFAQAVDRANDAAMALAEIEREGDAENIRLATEALVDADIVFDAASIEFYMAVRDIVEAENRASAALTDEEDARLEAEIIAENHPSRGAAA